MIEYLDKSIINHINGIFIPVYKPECRFQSKPFVSFIHPLSRVVIPFAASVYILSNVFQICQF